MQCENCGGVLDRVEPYGEYEFTCPHCGYSRKLSFDDLVNLLRYKPRKEDDGYYGVLDT